MNKKLGPYTLLKDEAAYKRFLRANQNGPGEVGPPAEYPCLVFAHANYQENTDFTFLYSHNVEAMLEALALQEAKNQK